MCALFAVGDDGEMTMRRHTLRFVALAVVVAMPLLGMSGVASAKAAGCHKTKTCKSAGGTGSGGPTTTAPMAVQVDPNPLVETGQSYVYATVQVETSASFAGDPVDISSPQLSAVCEGAVVFTAIGASPGQSITVTLDDDGNATVVVVGENCAPGASVIEADLAVAPYDTALTTLDAEPPVVTTPGVTGYPQTSGTVTGGEVETGDTGSLFGGSYVYGVFYVETDPVYAEQTVEISSPELQARCGAEWVFSPLLTGTSSLGTGSTVISPNTTASTTLDDDGNAVFVFAGASCAAGSSEVIADVEAGTHQTDVTSFSILPPQPTI